MGRGFDELVAAGMAAPVEGWDFSWAGDRRRELDRLPWRWFDLITDAVRATAGRRVVDLGTGGGEVVAGWLAEVAAGGRPELVAATESWHPNVAVAGRRLRPLGAAVLEVEGAPDNLDWHGPGSGGRLPFRRGSFDVVVSRHEAYAPDEVRSVLADGGRFLTQQVGGDNEVEWEQWFGRPGEHTGRGWGLAEAVAQAAGAGFEMLDSGEAFPRVAFADVGAVVHYHRLIPWFVPAFDPLGADAGVLRQLHERIADGGPLVLTSHRYWFVARPR